MKNPLSVEICRDKSKLLELFLGSAFFVALGTIFLILPSYSIISAIIMRAIGLTNVLCFGLGFIVFGKQLIAKGPAIIINDAGITEKGGALPAGFIPWEDITTMFRLEAPSHEILMIRVKNPSTYISRHTGFLTRKTAELNCRIYGTPVCINTGSLQYSFEELKFLMLQKIDNHHLLHPDPNPHFDLVAL
jgi:hypothetical protein